MLYDCLLCVQDSQVDNKYGETRPRVSGASWIGDLTALLGLGPERIPWTPWTGPTPPVAHLVQPDKAPLRSSP